MRPDVSSMAVSFSATNECVFQPMVQSKEYYLANLDRDSHSSGYEHFVSNTSTKYAHISEAFATLPPDECLF